MLKHNAAECTHTIEGLRSALTVFSGKWKLQIIVALLSGVHHFRGLERSIPGISTKVLAKELKDLEAHQLLARTVHPGPPVVVEYQALPYASTLEPVISILKDWGNAHQLRLDAASTAPAQEA
ncbi:winged helix-turn-helix transcriptional regulator [Hymenobacter defluvii]|uniref:Helix-turn-helix transcriptional regulator n=1 Tax=Hymenobacter defluvii TaxID=2054411 RepID=A0ABS3TBN4_9BACT|nr:helix-turn-helix domain-containing protein [Hymenobacter defluvii]MBO3271062.1 helix-turn-helix transcriptional regulator [Hymenobacter defluvii]